MPDNSPPSVDVKVGGRLMHIPLPWLAAILVALIFNAGIMYAQFDAVKEKLVTLAADTKQALTVSTANSSKLDEIQSDHKQFKEKGEVIEKRLDDLERNKR